jgi:hypothetical protein
VEGGVVKSNGVTTAVAAMRPPALMCGTLVFAAVHLLWYTRVVALSLWDLKGGVQQDGRMTAYGASDWAWTVSVHLPAGLFFVTGLDGVGLLFLLAGSLVSGFAAAELILGSRGSHVLDAWKWRLWLFLAGWAWVPVPAAASWVYQWTVLY